MSEKPKGLFLKKPPSVRETALEFNKNYFLSTFFTIVEFALLIIRK